MGTYGLLAFQYYLVTFISPEDGRHYVNRAERLASVNYHDCFQVFCFSFILTESKFVSK